MRALATKKTALCALSPGPRGSTRQRGRLCNARALFRKPSGSGLTLVEVLMSMLVMGIGVLSVVAILPLAFVRSVQATNLTNGTILRFNAESQIYLDQLDYEYIFPNWQPGTTYTQGAATTGGPLPPPPSIVLGSQGNVRFRCTTSGTSMNPGPPPWITIVGQTTTEPTTGVTWIAEDHSHFVIDPLGWNTMAFLGNNLQGVLGNNAGTTGTIGVPPNGSGIERFNAGVNASVDGGSGTTADANSVALASLRVTLPDSWAEQARGPATNVLANSVQLAGIDLSAVTYFGAVAPTNGSPGAFPSIASRVVLTNATQPSTAGKSAQTRLITNITVGAGPVSTITWGGGTNDPLPTGFVPSQLRVETQDRRYTWMLTVRRTSAGFPNVDVTVFFNRTLTTDDEQTFSSIITSQTQFTVAYGATKPFAKKGGFLFDVTYGRWYRVTNLTDNGSALTITVDRPRPSTEGVLGSGFTAVFMRGVVNVYSFPLKS